MEIKSSNFRKIESLRPKQAQQRCEAVPGEYSIMIFMNDGCTPQRTRGPLWKGTAEERDKVKRTTSFDNHNKQPPLSDPVLHSGELSLLQAKQEVRRARLSCSPRGEATSLRRNGRVSQCATFCNAPTVRFKVRAKLVSGGVVTRVRETDTLDPMCRIPGGIQEPIADTEKLFLPLLWCEWPALSAAFLKFLAHWPLKFYW